jgi:hypothetical protein
MQYNAIISLRESWPVQNEREIYDIKFETLKSWDHLLNFS